MTTPTTAEERPVEVGDQATPMTARTAAIGLGMVAGAAVVAVVIDPAAAPFVLPVIVLGALGAVLVVRFGRWAAALAAFLGLAALSNLGSPVGQLALASPDSFFDFVPHVALGAGGVLALVGGALGATRGRRSAGLAGLRRGAGVVVALAAVGSLLATLVGGTSVDPAVAAAADLELAVDEEGFAPQAAQVALVGDQATVLVRNTGRIAHTFTSAELAVDVPLSPGDEVLVEVPAGSIGAIAYWCTPHSTVVGDGGREGMVGELTIE